MTRTPDFSEDDFEFDEPQTTKTSQRTFQLSSAAGQEQLIQYLGRMQGVQGIMISGQKGEVLREKAVRESKSLSGVMAASVMLFGKGLKLISVSCGQQTICMRPLAGYYITVVAGPQVNIGRLLAEIGQLEVSQ